MYTLSCLSCGDEEERCAVGWVRKDKMPPTGRPKEKGYNAGRNRFDGLITAPVINLDVLFCSCNLRPIQG